MTQLTVVVGAEVSGNGDAPARSSTEWINHPSSPNSVPGEKHWVCGMNRW